MLDDAQQQALVALHRVREQWMKTRTARINTLRGVLREHGLLLPRSLRRRKTDATIVGARTDDERT